VTRLRIAAGAILLLAAAGAFWALLLMAGVKAFPAESFLTYPPKVHRQVFNTLAITGVAGAVAAAVMAVTHWPRPRLASLGLAIALCGAAILLLLIGIDLVAQQDLVRETNDHIQLMFWYHVGGAIQYPAFACLVIGWTLWLGAVLTARWRRAGT
jgi:hypothetical protein